MYHEAGWVLDLKQWYNADKKVYIIKARVKHSQSMNDTPLKPWTAVAQDGEILFAHCDCMAGLGEVCSHMAASMFNLVAYSSVIKDIACTSRPNEWLPPTMKEVPYAEVSEINFKKKKTDKPKTTKNMSLPKFAPPTAAEKKTLYDQLKATGSKPAILSLVPGYSDDYVPVSTKLPPSLNTLYNDKHENLTPDELNKLCIETLSKLSISKQQVELIAETTKAQSKSKNWYMQRAGRVTASNAKGCFTTSIENPSVSLVKKICYPDVYKFTSKTTAWGCEHEAAARDHYILVMRAHPNPHPNFKVSQTGFHISQSHPFMGASPDGISKCDCCGIGVIEVKCPCKSDFGDVKYLLNVGNGFKLDRSHTYYYQMQVQMHVLNVKHCDFIVWLQKKVTIEGKECEQVEVYIERVHQNSIFINDVLIPKCQEFFQSVILCELLARKYTKALPVTRMTSPTASTSSANLVCKICYCGQQNLDSTVIECQSADCVVKRYHMACIGLKRKPSSNTHWLCSECKKKATTSKASTGALSVTTNPVPSTGALSVTTNPVVSTGALSVTTNPVASTGALSVTTNPVPSTGALSVTANPLASTRALPVTTNPMASTGTTSPTANSSSVCYCGRELNSIILECQSPDCLVKRYHMECVGLKRKPSSKYPWLCGECKQKYW